MRAVGADDQVGLHHGAVGQRGADPGLVRLERGYPRAEAVLGHVPGGLVEHVGQITAQDLECRDDPVAVERLDRHLRTPRAVGSHPGDAALKQAPLGHRGQQAHSGDHLATRAAQVDRLPARAHTRCRLDDDHPIAVAGQPVGQGRSGDSGAADQHRLLHHGESLWLSQHWLLGWPHGGHRPAHRPQRHGGGSGGGRGGDRWLPVPVAGGPGAFGGQTQHPGDHRRPDAGAPMVSRCQTARRTTAQPGPPAAAQRVLRVALLGIQHVHAIARRPHHRALLAPDGVPVHRGGTHRIHAGAPLSDVGHHAARPGLPDLVVGEVAPGPHRRHQPGRP
ncbi:Uncharacterised protein [Mycobacteroides abscessus subsp. abscessus]|nr:Uncharacterised protein [Mycobacteroides abscessus subsp. abscessus]